MLCMIVVFYFFLWVARHWWAVCLFWCPVTKLVAITDIALLCCLILWRNKRSLFLSLSRASFGAHHENLNEDRLYCLRQRCSPMTLDSDNIRFMWIFAGVPWKGASYNSGVIENVFFSLSTLRIRHLRKWGQHYYIVLFSPLSPFHWPQNTWTWITDWLEGSFYVICSLLRTATD